MKFKKAILFVLLYITIVTTISLVSADTLLDSVGEGSYNITNNGSIGGFNGIINRSFNFTRISSVKGGYMNITTDFNITNYPFSFNVWVNTTTSGESGEMDIIGFGSTANDGVDYFVGINGTNKLFILARDNSELDFSGGGDFSNNGSYVMITVVFLAHNDRRVYLNGNNVLNQTVANIDFLISDLEFRVGASVSTGGSIANPFNGEMDEVGVWNRTLNLSSVRELFNGGLAETTPFTQNLNTGIKAYYKLDDEVQPIEIDNCSSLTNIIYDYTMVSEDNQTILNGSSDNTSIEIDVRAFSSNGSISLFNYSAKHDKQNPITICSSTLDFNSNFRINSTVKYSASSHAVEYYNIRNATLDGTTPIQNITLFDLLTSRSKAFQITFKDINFVVVEDATISVDRQYVSEGVFKTVEIPITDSNGQAVANLVEEEIVYNFIVRKGSEVIGTFNNFRAFCEDSILGQCFITLNALQGNTISFNYDDVIGLGFAFDYNETIRDLKFTFVTTDSLVKNVTMNMTKFDRFGDTVVCTTSLVASSGTINCTIPPSLGNASVTAKILVDGEEKLQKFIRVSQRLSIGTDGYFLLFVMLITLAFMFVDSKAMTVISVILGFVIAILFYWIEGGIIGAGSSIMWLVIAGLILIWKLNKDGQT